MAVSQFLIIL